MNAQPRIMVAMSGGVDSSVAAALLVEQGYDVVGAFMKNWDGCDWKRERRDAMRVASVLGIPLHTFDFEREYRARVHAYLVEEYRAGRTPNPDVLCNSEIKFDLLLKATHDLDCAEMATGHYARVRRDGSLTRLLKGVDPKKDQSYFLCRLVQAQLTRTQFPIGALTKIEVRRRARALGLATADKKDSQGLCFVGKVDMALFLKSAIDVRPGKIVTTSGKVVGTHDGVAFYTIGQRKGLGIGTEEPYFVVERRHHTNELVVAHEGDAALYRTEIKAADVQWISGNAPTFPFSCTAQIRYRQQDQNCTIVQKVVGITVTFDEPQRAVAPGQFMVFYDGDELIGSGVINYSHHTMKQDSIILATGEFLALRKKKSSM